MNALKQWLEILSNEEVEPQELVANFDLTNLRYLRFKAEQFRDNIISCITTNNLPEEVSIMEAGDIRDRVMRNIRTIDKAIISLNQTQDIEMSDHVITLYQN